MSETEELRSLIQRAIVERWTLDFSNIMAAPDYEKKILYITPRPQPEEKESDDITNEYTFSLIEENTERIRVNGRVYVLDLLEESKDDN